MNKQGNNRQSNQKLRQQTPPAPACTILQRISRAERDAVEDCISLYGNLVWALARKFARSAQDAEKSAIVIFNDIWAQAPFYDSVRYSEENYVLQIAVRRLIKQSVRRRR
jgi:DNA-directed RNA polymerase specialized sigma24 family protein